MRTPVQNALLALLLEVCGTPKPGNVDRQRDLSALRFEHFLAGAVGASPGLQLAAAEAPIGEAFERGIQGMAAQSGGNTQFGALLLVIPLVQAASQETEVETVVAETTVADAAAFYRAFDHVDVFVSEPPAEASPLDVRRGSDAIPALRARDLTLRDVLALGVPGDDVAREWTTSFERSFRAAELLAAADGPLEGRSAETFCRLLAARPDTLVMKKHGRDVAQDVLQRAQSVFANDRFDVAKAEGLAEELVAREINPGTTADLVAAGLFIALEREAITV